MITGSNLNLDTQMQFIKGVGLEKAKSFAKLGVNTAADLLEYFPRDWIFLPQPRQIIDVREGDEITVIGIVETTDFLKFRKPPVFEASIADETGTMRVIWFNGRYLINQLHVGMRIAVYGKVSVYKHQLQMSNPKFRIISDEDSFNVESFGGAVYPATSTLSSGHIKRIVKNLIDELCEPLQEYFTEDFRAKNGLLSRKQAFRQIHDPADEEMLAQAQRTLKYEELFLMQLGLALRRYKTRSFSPAAVMKWSDELDSHIRRRFPFLLTEDQNAVINEIINDLGQAKPMNRLLQGDVGSGKTVIAVYAALMAVANKVQVSIMAPTEILAQQHFLNIERYLKGSKVKTVLLTGSMNAKRREKILAEIESGQIHIVVGTVALIQHDVQFDNLGLVIIDEQHKFGVDQRASLRKGKMPHCLVMTATPIPRTLTMTAFGDLDVSIIKHTPPGRGKVTTRWVGPHDRSQAMEFIRARLRAKKQAYFVYPRITNSDPNSDVKAAQEEYQLLKKKIFPEFKVALLHGQMNASDKQAVMDDFRHARLDILVSTVVIEVGVDVPNATIMVIEGANHFGLAQLHQLRGRIGRGQSNSYCLLFADTDNEIAKSRLEMLEKSSDGFKIAEYDMSLRGPGELFSTRQHGVPDLKIANIIEDFDLLNKARIDAFEMVRIDPCLERPEHRYLRNSLLARFGQKLGLTDVG